MSRKESFALTTFSIVCIVSTGVGGFLWNTRSCYESRCFARFSTESLSKRHDSTLSYPKFLKLVQAGANGSCMQVVVAPGEPVFEVTLKDYSVRKVWVPIETREKVIFLLNQNDIPIWIPCRK